VVEYHLTWWRERAEAAFAELDELRAKYRELAEQVDNQRRSEGEDPDSCAQREGASQDDSIAEEAETEPTTFLGHARRELLDLCRQFEGTIPYWRLKNTMHAFSDKLTSDERVLLAQEIGAEGSLIRWCTTQIESLGWRVTDNPVSGEAEAMMDAWDRRCLPDAEEEQMAVGPVPVARRQSRKVRHWADVKSAPIWVIQDW
jgi:hypothetical protein